MSLQHVAYELCKVKKIENNLFRGLSIFIIVFILCKIYIFSIKLKKRLESKDESLNYKEAYWKG